MAAGYAPMVSQTWPVSTSIGRPSRRLNT